MHSGSTNDLTTFVANGDKVLNAATWLKANYEPCEGVSVARCILYSHYTQACRQCGMEWVNPASFGKIFETFFPPSRLGDLEPEDSPSIIITVSNQGT